MDAYEIENPLEDSRNPDNNSHIPPVFVHHDNPEAKNRSFL